MRSLAALLLLPTFLLADDPTNVTPPKKEEAAKPAIRMQLKDGAVFRGEFDLPEVVITTAYGALTVPAADVVRIRIGKQSDPDLLAQIAKLVADLGSDEAAARNRAQEQLARLGRAAETELRAAAKSQDPEVKNRAASLLAEIENASDDDAEALPDEDELVTVRFAVRGSLRFEKLELATTYGALSIPKKELRVVTFDRGGPDSAKLEVACDNGPANAVGTKLMVHKGDRVVVKADGTIAFRGGGTDFGPEGNEQYGKYLNAFPTGCLVGRIGTSGNWFKVGAKWQGKAAKDGMLYLSVAMDPQYARGSSGSYDVTVEVTPGGE